MRPGILAAAAAALPLGLALILVPASQAIKPSDTVSQGGPSFRGTIALVDAAQAKRMTGVSWRQGCPVPLRDLRVLTFSHWGFDRRMRTAV